MASEFNQSINQSSKQASKQATELYELQIFHNNNFKLLV
jgi:hypothetical protein